MTANSASLPHDSHTGDNASHPPVRSPAERNATLSCVRCGQANQASRRFCDSCGAALKTECFACELEVAVSARFCGGCGTNLEQAFFDRWMNAHWTLTVAWHCVQESRFIEAEAEIAAALRESADDPRLDPFCKAIEVLKPKLARKKAAVQAQVDQMRLEAEAAREQQSLARTVRAITSIPAALRKEHEEDELRRAQIGLAELKSLREQIKPDLIDTDKFAAADHAELLEKVNRVLELDPTDRQMRNLASELGKRNLDAQKASAQELIQNTKACLAENDYMNALRNLESISPAAWNAKHDQFRIDLRELSWLEQELRRQPFASTSLMKFAERLQKLRSSDSRGKAWFERLRQQLGGIAKGPGGADEVLWTRPPEKTFLGPTVLPVAWSKSAARDTETSNLGNRQRANQLTVAFGVALQGLGLARIDMNLIAKLTKSKRGGFFGKVDKSAACGIDVGASSVKIVKLVQADGKPKCTIAEILPHETPLQRLANIGDRKDMLVATLKKAVEKHDLKNCRIGLSVGGNQCLGRFFELPAIEKSAKDAAKRFKELVRFEAEAQIPFPLDDVCWDWHHFAASDSEKSPVRSQQVALVAAKADDLREKLDALEQAGIKPDYAQGECFAIYNVLANSDANEPAAEELSRKERPVETRAIIECGSQSTSIVIGSDRHVWFRSFPRAGEDVTRELARELRLTLEQAELVKCQPWRAKHVHLLAEKIAGSVDDWVGEVGRTLDAYRSIHPSAPITNVLLSGGGSGNFVLTRHLARGS